MLSYCFTFSRKWPTSFHSWSWQRHSPANNCFGDILGKDMWSISAWLDGIHNLHSLSVSFDVLLIRIKFYNRCEICNQITELASWVQSFCSVLFHSTFRWSCTAVDFVAFNSDSLFLSSNSTGCQFTSLYWDSTVSSLLQPFASSVKVYLIQMNSLQPYRTCAK